MESRGDENATIQVTQWMRAALTRRKQPDHSSFRKSLFKEAAKELKKKEFTDTVEVFHTARQLDIEALLRTQPSGVKLEGLVRSDEKEQPKHQDDMVDETQPTVEERLGGLVRDALDADEHFQHRRGQSRGAIDVPAVPDASPSAEERVAGLYRQVRGETRHQQHPRRASH